MRRGRFRRLAFLLALGLLLFGGGWLAFAPRAADLAPTPGDRTLPAADPAPGSPPGLAGSARGPDAGEAAVLSRSGVVLRGRVVDQARRRVEGVAVQVVRAEAPDAAARTDAQGNFRLVLPGSSEPSFAWSLVARADDGRAATRALLLPPAASDVELGTLVLGEGTTVGVLVSDERGRPVAGARVFGALHSARADAPMTAHFLAPWSGWTHEATTGADGRAALHGVPEGALRLVAVAQGPLHGSVLTRAPTPYAEDVDLVLRPARDVRIEVVDAADGRPVEGARLTLWDRRFLAAALPYPLLPTDAEGTSLLRAVPLGADWAVSATVTGWAWPRGHRAPGAIPPEATHLRLELPVGTIVRFPLLAGDGPLPDASTPVRIHDTRTDPTVGGGALADEGRIAEGQLLVRSLETHGFPRAVASLPDGRVGVLAASWSRTEGAFRAEPVAFRRPRRLVVVAQEPDGAPASEVHVVLFRDGGGRTGWSRTTDEVGRAAFEGLPAELLEVRSVSAPEFVEPIRRGVFGSGPSVDLSQGDANLVLDVPARRTARVEVEAEGVVGMPAGAVLGVAVVPETLAWGEPADTSLDVAGGVFSFRVRPPVVAPGETARTWLEARVRAPGFAEARARLEAAGADGSLLARLILRRATALRVRVLPPADGLADVHLEHLDPDGTWRASDVEPPAATDDGADAVHEGVAPDTYRLRELLTGRVTEPLVLTLDTPPPLLFLDLTRAGWAEGALDYPEALTLDARQTGVIVEGEGIDRRGLARWGPSLSVDPRACTFRVRVPGDRPVTLRPVDARCRPDATEGEVTLTAPTSGLRLRLVEAR